MIEHSFRKNMQASFQQLVAEVDLSSFSPDVLQQLTSLLQQRTEQSPALFVAQEYSSLLLLEHQVWHILSEGADHWFSHPYCSQFFHALGSLNKTLVFQSENVADHIKAALLVDESIDLIDAIFERIEKSPTDDDPLITFVSLWFDNLSYLVHEYPQFSRLPVIIHINECFGRHFLLSKKFQFYLTQLRQPSLPSEVFTAKQLFYMKTCPFSLNAYFYTNPTTFGCTRQDVLKNIGDEYLQVVQTQSCVVDSWSKELLACIAHLIGFMRAFLWWDEGSGVALNGLLLTEKMLCEYIQAIVRVIEYEPLYQYITTQWLHNETFLMDSLLLFLMNIVQSQKINWFFRSMTQLPNVLFKLAATSAYYRIYLCAYGILSEVLTEEHLKELKVTDSIRLFFFNMLEQAWQHPLKKYKQIPITYFLRGFLNLAKNDFIQEGTAKSKKITLFIDMCDQYSTVFNIIWALSFNRDIQQQLRSNASFINKLSHLATDSEDEHIRKATSGILWNLDTDHHRRLSTDIADDTTFDIMISYSHKDKILCKQLYDELTRRGYRVWIDFDQMHGNVMDAMAQAIDHSQTIIICMSEQYRKSNFCRAEAHYAFQQQRHIVPVLMQKHYKADGWLLFLIGQLLYVDFTKYEFGRAMEMLMKELKGTDGYDDGVKSASPKEDTDSVLSTLPVPPGNPEPSPVLASHLLQWSPSQVHHWLSTHNLLQLSRLLVDCDGRSLVHFYKYIKHGPPSQVMALLHDESRRRLQESLSLIELSCFHSLMHQHREVQQALESIMNTGQEAC